MYNKKKTVIILGKGKLAIKVAQWFLENPAYSVKCVIPVIPEPLWTDSFKNWANIAQVPIIDSGHYKDIPNIEKTSWHIDLVVSVTYDKIIKDWFIKKCKRIINIHNGPLPKYRGVSPINWALKNNEDTHGVTIHEITPGIDDGPIISQVIFSIYPKIDEVIDVYNRCLDFGWILFLQTLPLLNKIKASMQDEEKAIYYHHRQDNLLGERKNFTRKKST
jgi:methionyl-tRNA formyltransferase